MTNAFTSRVKGKFMFMCCCWSQIMWKRRRRTQVLFLRVNMMPAGVIQQLSHNYHIYPLQITINMFLEVPLSWINCIKRRESENFLLVVVEKAITNSIFHSRPIFMSCDFCANYIVPRERIKYFFFHIHSSEQRKVMRYHKLCIH